ncbi:MAG: glycosyltransferase family 4 protein [Planctomycetes bacterium]|nr:glycosyltransferase family 4 protein [Planctomycetota bacterium]
MRVLYVCSDHGVKPDGVKGASVHLRAITAGLARLGHEVQVLSPNGAPGGDHPAPAVLPDAPGISAAVRPLKNWLLEHGLDEGVAREFRSLLYNAWANEQAPAAMANRPPEAIVERLSLFSHLGLDLATAFDVPLVVEVNAPLTKEAAEFRSLHLRSLAGEIERRVLERADRVVVVSAALRERLTAKGVHPDKIHVVPNGVDVHAFSAAPPRQECRAALGLRDEFVVGFAGSLKAWHGVDVLLAAFRETWRRDSKARLVIVGTGPAEPMLRQMADTLGLCGAVIFTGAVPHERVPALLAAMDVAVAPFRAVEDFYFSPIKLFEYMASGACVVASRLGQIQEVIKHEVSGLLCAPDDVSALAASLETARRSPALRARLSASARATVETGYTWKHTAGRVEQVLVAALAGHRARAGTPRDLRPEPAAEALR